jgi:hypothetical protein
MYEQTCNTSVGKELPLILEMIKQVLVPSSGGSSVRSSNVVDWQSRKAAIEGK